MADAVARTPRAGMGAGEVIVVGHSAGAQLAAVVALTPGSFTSGCADPPVATDRFVGLAGPYDVTQVGGMTHRRAGNKQRPDHLWGRSS
ncbi:hypothetical protein [Demequina sp.]|uniref:hypothetical protein n=1 Tax=Demequina sp. TaxID=2050685 RepID=UPI0025B81664|nr:hypothetical protein [Demequina sp.]